MCVWCVLSEKLNSFAQKNKIVVETKHLACIHRCHFDLVQNFVNRLTGDE